MRLQGLLAALCTIVALASLCNAEPFEIGVSFSGGGIRATIGTLAAINQMLPDLQGIVPRGDRKRGASGIKPDHMTTINSVSATSGGTWGLSLQFINDRATNKTAPGVISRVREFIKDGKKWGPEGGLSDMNAERFNEEWSDRICFALYKPFENGMNKQEGDFLRGKSNVLPSPPIPPPREKMPIPYRMCTWLWQYRGIDQEIRANAKASHRANYLSFNAYLVQGKHAVLPRQVAELRGSSDMDVPDFFLRYNIAADQFEECRAIECSHPRPAEVFIAKDGTTEKTLKIKSREEAQWVLNPPSDMSKWERLDTRRSGTILDLLGFASAAWTSNQIPEKFRASIALCAIRTRDSRELRPIILTDAGVFQNNPLNTLGQQIVVSFDFSDISRRNTWLPEIKGPIDASKLAEQYETEVVPMKEGGVDPDVKFIIHRFKVRGSDTQRVVFQVPARFVKDAHSYSKFPTMVGNLGADVNRYTLGKLNDYYEGLKGFYKNITGDLRTRIAHEAFRVIAQREPKQPAANPKAPAGPKTGAPAPSGQAALPSNAPPSGPQVPS